MQRVSGEDSITCFSLVEDFSFTSVSVAQYLLQLRWLLGEDIILATDLKPLCTAATKGFMYGNGVSGVSVFRPPLLSLPPKFSHPVFTQWD